MKVKTLQDRQQVTANVTPVAPSLQILLATISSEQKQWADTLAQMWDEQDDEVNIFDYEG